MLKDNNWLVIVFSISILFSCVDKNRKIDVDTPQFSTTDATKLFFKNTRQIYYEKEELGKARMEVFRKKTRKTTSDRAILNLAIANNWMYDEAYIRLEPNAFFEDPNHFEIVWENNQTSQKGVYSFSVAGKESHFKLASQLYMSLIEEHTLALKQNAQLYPLFVSSEEKDTFRITMVDYYRLVGLFY